MARPASSINEHIDPFLDRLWRDSDADNRAVIVLLAYLIPPVSIDTLVFLSGTPVVTVLTLIKKLMKRRVVCQRRESGEGVYFLNGMVGLSNFVDKHLSEQQTRDLLTKIKEKNLLGPNQAETTILPLANLYMRLEEDRVGLNYVMQAAHLLYQTGHKKKAVEYYDYVIGHFSEKSDDGSSAMSFLESVYRKVSMLWYQMPLPEMRAVLERGHEVAKRGRYLDYLAKMKLLLGLALVWSGEIRRASRYTTGFWKLMRAMDDPDLKRTAVILTSVVMSLKGRISEATDYYEKMTGNQEQFGDDEQALAASCIIAGGHVASGRVARGLGMFDALRAKAESLNLQSIVGVAEFGKASALIDIQRIPEAEVWLAKAFKLAENEVDYILKGFMLNCSAYLHYKKMDFAGALDCLKEGRKYLMQSLSRASNPFNAWIFECLYSLEAEGFPPEEVGLDAEIRKAIDGDSVHMKGSAYRYQALRRMKENEPSEAILSDLHQSEKYLRLSGGRLELARTHIVLGSFLVEGGNSKAGRPLLERAWNFFSTIDKNLFPKELLGYLSPTEKMSFMMERITNANESLGALRDASSFLERAINIAMDFTMAMRAAFLVQQADGTISIVANRNLDASFFGRSESDVISEHIRDAARVSKQTLMALNEQEEGGFQEGGNTSFVCMPVRLGERVHGYLYLDKPFEGSPFPQERFPFLKMLCSQIAVGLDNIEIHDELREQRDRSEDEVIFYRREIGAAGSPEMITGGSPAMRTVLELIRQVAHTNASVMIIGETGVGKELVAKAIHNLSSRSDKPFIPVNLATLPQELVASELFGHEKGAFTGALALQKGRFELANGGTLFLDEIGDLPLTIQVKLLRVLQEKSFERVGSSRPVYSDFRVISATSRNLTEAVDKGLFRQDLYYRLNVFPIHVPPLRERLEDIPFLAYHFAEKYGKKMGRKRTVLATAELKKLQAYHWPGNVRELEHFVERALIISQGPVIDLSIPERTPPTLAGEGEGVVLPLADMVARYLEKILRLTRWRVKGPHGAAQLLGLKPTTLFSLMHRHGIHRPI
jgi:transcriptional regulator with GAF, ATPase, and Fis domain